MNKDKWTILGVIIAAPVVLMIFLTKYVGDKEPRPLDPNTVPICYEEYSNGGSPQVELTENNKDAMLKYTDAHKKISSGLYVTSGIQIMSEAADLGLTDAMNYLGFLYQTGGAVEIDHGESKVWYEKSASRGDCLGQYNLALLLYSGLGAEQNIPRAVELYTLSAEQGMLYAANNLGIHYIEVDDDFEQAYKWLIQAHNGNLAQSNSGLGDLYYNHGDNENALKYYRLAAQTGDVDAMLNTAVLIKESDADASIMWLKKASDAGNTEAKAKLAVEYVIGNHIEKQPEVALELLQQVIYIEPLAQMLKGSMYFDGIGVEANSEYGYVWMAVAQINGIDIVGIYKDSPDLDVNYMQSDAVMQKAQRCIDSQYKDCP